VKTRKAEFYESNWKQAVNTKQRWQFVNKLLEKKAVKRGVGNLQWQNEMVKDDEKKANILNEYFSQTVNNILDTNVIEQIDLVEVTKQDKKIPTFFLNPTFPNEINWVVNSLKPNSASGLDDCSINVIQKLC